MGHSHPNHREITLKVVYYGPALAGKTTSFMYLHRALRQDARGQIVQVTTGSDRTMFFDFFPLPSPRLRGNALRVQIYTAPGHVRSESTRRGLLTDMDGLVFVADSQRVREGDNVEALEQLRYSLGEMGLRLEQVPHVFAWNKRDMEDVCAVAELQALLNPRRAPALETVALSGKGVFDTLKAITGLVLSEITGRRKPSPGSSNGHSSAVSTNKRMQAVTAAQQALAGLDEVPTGPAPSAAAVPPPPPPPPTMIKQRADERLSAVPTALRNSRPPLMMPAVPVVPAGLVVPGGQPVLADAQPIHTDETQLRKRPSPSPSPTWLQPLSPESVTSAPQGVLREVWLSQMLPQGALRDQVHEVELDLSTGQNAQAVRRAGGFFYNLTAAAAARESEEGPSWRALSLGLPIDRYLRFREAVRSAEAGTATREDGLFALFFVLDAVLRK